MKYFEDVAIGETTRFGRYEVTREEIVEYARQFDPQPFHLSEEGAKGTIFGSLAASGWYTAAITMKLLVEGELRPAGGILGLGFEEFRWPRPVRPGDELRVQSEILEVRPSKSRPGWGLIKVRNTTTNQAGDAVQVVVGNLMVPARNSGGA